MRNERKGPGWLLTFSLAALAAWGGWAVRGRQMNAEAEIQAHVAAAYHDQAQEARKGAEAADARASKAELAVQGAQAEVQGLKLRLASHPRPTPVPAAPPEDAELHHQLVQLMKEPPRLRADAVSVWEWHAEALRVPPLEQRLRACEDLTEAQDRQAAALGREVTALATARDGYRNALDLETKRGNALQVTASPPRWSVGLGTSVDPRDGRKRVAAYVGSYLNRSVELGGGSINGGAFLMAVYHWGNR